MITRVVYLRKLQLYLYFFNACEISKLSSHNVSRKEHASLSLPNPSLHVCLKFLSTPSDVVSCSNYRTHVLFEVGKKTKKEMNLAALSWEAMERSSKLPSPLYSVPKYNGVSRLTLNCRFSKREKTEYGCFFLLSQQYSLISCFSPRMPFGRPDIDLCWNRIGRNLDKYRNGFPAFAEFQGDRFFDLDSKFHVKRLFFVRRWN